MFDFWFSFRDCAVWWGTPQFGPENVFIIWLLDKACKAVIHRMLLDPSPQTNPSSTPGIIIFHVSPTIPSFVEESVLSMGPAQTVTLDPRLQSWRTHLQYCKYTFLCCWQLNLNRQHHFTPVFTETKAWMGIYLKNSYSYLPSEQCFFKNILLNLADDAVKKGSKFSIW
jgi:hypothetical protein